MIVISAYNNISVLEKLLSSLNVTENLDEKVLVVSTDHRQVGFVDYLKSIDKTKYKYDLDVDFSPLVGYEPGAIIHAYKNHVDDYYIFLQDSLMIINPQWLNIFKSHRKKGTINAWAWFNSNLWDNNLQSNWVFSRMGGKKEDFLTPEFCIFGNIFQSSRDDLDKIDEKFKLENFIENNKILCSCGMERGWAYLAKNSGVGLDFVFGKYEDVCQGVINEKTLFKKEFLHRY